MGVINYVEYARARSAPDLARILEKADRELQRIGDIVDNLLRYARPSNTDPIAVDLQDVVRRAADLLAADLRSRDVLVTDHIPMALPRARGDPGALQQVCLNLPINARDAVSGSLRREIEIRGGDLPGLVWVEIADSGPGVPADLKTAIFDPFFSTKPPGKGTGLGLPISLSIVDSLGGLLELRDTDGAGTVFRITLPSAPDEDEPEAVHPENTDASVRSRQAR